MYCGNARPSFTAWAGVLGDGAGRDLERDDLLGVGVQAAAEQGAHLVLADPTGDLQVGGTGADPATGRVARGGVVVGQLLAGGAALVAGGDLPGEVRL